VVAVALVTCLILEAFLQLLNVSNPTISAPIGPRIMETQTMSIGSAFDDLLGLQTTGPIASSEQGVELTMAAKMAISQPTSTKSNRKMCDESRTQS
jgi:hypothetical protein